MLPRFHILFSTIVFIILLLFNINFLLIALFFISSIVIDVDHYFLYIARKKDLSLRKAYYYNRFELAKKLKKAKQKTVLCIFHTIESFIVLFLLALSFNLIFPIFFGALFHETTDLIADLIRKNKTYNKYKRAHSLIFYVIKKYKNK